MAVDVRTASWWDWLRLQVLVGLLGLLWGLVTPNRGFAGLLARSPAGRLTASFLGGLRRRYGCGHLWTRFPFRRTLLVLDPASFDEVLRSADNAGDAALKKVALSRFAPDALVVSSGAAWEVRRPFNEAVLGFGRLHPEAAAFRDVVVAEAHRMAAGPGVLRWSDFERFAQRASHQVLFGAGVVEPDLAADLAALLVRANWPMLPPARSRFAAFHGRLEARLAQPSGAPARCLAHASAAITASGQSDPATQVPSQVAFWCFVLNEALALHVARTLALLAAHPAAQGTVRREIRAAPGLSVEAIDGLAYLGACLDEQLRLWTPVPLLLRRAVHPFRLRGEIAVEAEDQILIHAGVYHRDPAVFGARAHAFDPEAALASPRPLYVFSAGRQSCAGEFLVRFVVKSALAALLARFRFEAIAPRIEPRAVRPLCDHPRIALRAVSDA